MKRWLEANPQARVTSYPFGNRGAVYRFIAEDLSVDLRTQELKCIPKQVSIGIDAEVWKQVSPKSIEIYDSWGNLVLAAAKP